ncbi:MAG: TetR/AcrR family transcriptional regulator [Alphaproteobacteria bacterium]
MARPREFDENEALARAMQVFWSKGYEATSLCDLIEAMGLSKSSFYDTFGSKHDLFLSAIDHYNETVASRRVAGVIADAENVRAGIARVFAGVVDDTAAGGERRGCFINNCAVELAPRDSAAAARVSAGFAHMETAFFEAVRQGQASGEIGAGRDARALARYLTSSLNGVIVMAKANADRAVLDDVVRVVLAALD